MDIPGEIVKEASGPLIPEKSRQRYEKELTAFNEWREKKGVREMVLNETVVLAYISGLAKTFRASSLWTKFSMLKKILIVNGNDDISRFGKVIAFMKAQNVGYTPKKSKVLTVEECRKFILEASDDDFLLCKVILIFGLYGACRRDELLQLTIDDIEDHEKYVQVQLKDTKTHTSRSFVIPDCSLTLNPYGFYKRFCPFPRIYNKQGFEILIFMIRMDIKEEPEDCNTSYAIGTRLYELSSNSNMEVDNSSVKQEISGDIHDNYYNFMNIKVEELDIKGEELSADDANIQTKVISNKKLLECKICSQKCTCKQSFNRPIKTHVRVKLFSCRFCKHKAVRKTDLRIHESLHLGERFYGCSICDYKALQKQQLIFHMRGHTGEKPFSCTICNFKTAYKQSLATHRKSHIEEKPYECSICKYRASQKRHLISHWRIHFGEKPFACGVCDYKTASKHGLKFHMKVHTDEEPYACNVCEFKTKRKEQLTSHVKAHAGDKPFACSICGFRTAYKHSLDFHVKTHTRAIKS